MTTYSPTHEGLERVLEGSRVLSDAVGPTRSLRTLPLVLLTGIVTAVVAAIAHRLDDWFIEGSTREWLALWALGALVSVVFARTAVRLGGAILVGAHRLSLRAARRRAEIEFQAAVDSDPRLLTELRAAKDRAEFA